MIIQQTPLLFRSFSLGARFDDGAGSDNEVQRTMLELINQVDLMLWSWVIIYNIYTFVLYV